MSLDIHHTITSHKIQLIEVGGRDKVMQGVITTLPYPSQDKTKRIRRRQILILGYKAITQRSRTRDEKEPSETSKVGHGKRECKVRDETRPSEKKILPTQSLLALCVKLKTLATNHRMKTTLSYRKITIMRKTPNHIYSGTER